ncbi:MAG TPA: hypothetical protein DCW91_02325 [Acinetobacter nosocomialis]|nr:hypothetical protein [Acinetobacter nosocomialis]
MGNYEPEVKSNFMNVIYAADIGSIKSNNFAWARLACDPYQINTDSSIHTLVQAIDSDLAQGKKVSIGFECPLFINLPSNPVLLTSARKGEGSRAWSAGAGCGSLTTGLIEVLWILSELKQMATYTIEATFSSDCLLNGNANLMIWEAFVSSNSKGKSHSEDAIIAVMKFYEKLNSKSLSSDIVVENPYSLAGAALLRSGITNNIEVLKEQCIVVKA